MIISTQKSMEEIKHALRNTKSAFLIGCSECASLCGTGDQNALDEMKIELEKSGITVTGSFIPKTGCQVLGTKRELKQFKNEIADADCMLTMSCGAGAQTLSELFPEKPVFTANDSKFLGNMSRFRQFDERCSMCGTCVINETGGICPVTRCPKGLLNGPCGGVNNGKCEVFPDLDCTWVKIYERMETLGELDSLAEYQEPKNHGEKVIALNLTADGAKK